ncbi:MAG: DNA polymerase III subunit delta' [Anaerohalosphaeraceae bacterium]
MQMRDIHSQDKAVAALQQAYAEGRIPHAYLFVGPDGVGKRTTAEAFARLLLCRSPIQNPDRSGPVKTDSCGRCPSCQLMDAGNHPDFVLIYKELLQYTEEGKEKDAPVEMPIDVVREFFIERAARKPVMGPYTVFVMEEAEKVNTSSQNAMMKILEEPPSFCIIILLCSRLEEMLPTTRSRCRILSFGPVSETVIVEELTRKGIDASQALFWARFSEGRLGEALRWARLRESGKPVDAYEIKKELAERLSRLEPADLIDTAGWLIQSAKAVGDAWARQKPNVSTKDLFRTAEKGLLRMVLTLLADLMKITYSEESSLVYSDQIEIVRQLSKKINAEEAAEKIINIQKLLGWVDANVNEKLIFERLLLIWTFSDILPVRSDD